MTFDDDVAYLMFDGGRRIYTLKSLGLDWPPPELISVQGFDMKLARRSQIPDELRAKMTHVCRAAEYFPVR